MTISNEIYRHDYAGNDSTVDFAISFYFLVDAHIKAILYNSVTDVETELTLTTHYTLTGAGVPAGGELTMIITPTSDETLTILRNVDLKQEKNYIEGESFPAEDHEEALDKLTMLIQQQQERVDRTLIQAESYPGNLELPMPVEDYFLRWAADELVNFDIADLSLYTVSSFMETLLDDTTHAAARATLEALPGKQSYFVDATEADQGLTGNGKTIKAYVDVIGTSKKATLILTHSSTGNTTAYTLTTSEIIPDNITVLIENGAVLDGAGTLTLSYMNYGFFQRFGTTITVLFTAGGGVTDIYPEWWGKFPNSYNDTTILNKAIAASNLVDSHDGVDDANIIIRPGRYYLTQNGLSVIKTNLLAANAYFSVIDNVVQGGYIFNFDFTEWGAANNIVEIGTILGKQTMEDVTHYNVGIKISGGDSCRMKVGSIFGLYAGVMSYGITHEKHFGMWDIDIDTLMGCDFGIYLTSGTTGGVNAGIESNRFRIRYAAFCDYVVWCDSSHADAIHIEGNVFRVGGMELHHRANQIGFFVKGADTYINKFIVDGNVVTNSTSQILHTESSAADNTFEICELDWSKIVQNGGANAIRETGNVDAVLDRQEETLTAAGACSIYGLTSFDTTAAAMAMTLADGTYIGQTKELTMTVDGGDVTLTVAKHETSSPEVFTLADVGDYLNLVWSGTVWITVKNYGAGV